MFPLIGGLSLPKERALARLTASIQDEEVSALCCVEIEGLCHSSITGDHQ